MKPSQKEQKDQKEQMNSNIPNTLGGTESFVFLKGTTCAKCKNKFPMPLTLQDNKITCPECETEVSAF